MQIFGHRGSGEGLGENTLVSFARAFDAGCVGVETDVRRCADGSLVCSHEAVVGGYTLLSTPYDVLATLGLVLLEDVLALARGRGRVIIEIKNVAWEPDFDAPDCASVIALDALVTDVDDVVVSSFDFYSAEAARDRGLRTAHLTHPGVRPLAGIAYAGDAGLDEVHAWVGDVLAEPACVEQAHAAGLRLVAWTATTKDQLDQLSAIGVDGVITDVVGAL